MAGGALVLGGAAEEWLVETSAQQLHKAIVSPKTALTVGLKVDVDALPRVTLDKLQKWTR